MAISANLLIQRRKLGWLLSLLVAVFWMLLGASVVLYWLLEPARTLELEIGTVTLFVLFFLPSILMFYYLTRPHVKKHFK
jgi:apolipoprotein N-acyltransferase